MGVNGLEGKQRMQTQQTPDTNYAGYIEIAMPANRLRVLVKLCSIDRWKDWGLKRRLIIASCLVICGY